VSGRPIDFVYVKDTDSFDLTRFPTDAHLLHKIRTGKGDKDIYKRRNLYVDQIFSGTYPEETDQDSKTGENDIVFAMATNFVYVIDLGRDDSFEKEWY